MGSTKAILLIFNGSTPSIEAVKEIATVLVQRCGAEREIEHFVYDANDLANLIARNGLNSRTIKFEQEPSKITPEENAVIFIGTMFRKQLYPVYRADAFMTALINEIAIARETPEDDKSRALMNALFVLSQEDLVISKEILRDYKLDEKKIAVIKRVYSLVKVM